jgi:hypothetical protein
MLYFIQSIMYVTFYFGGRRKRRRRDMVRFRV